MERDERIAVLIVDASAVFGGKLAYELASREGIDVVGVAAQAGSARRMILRRRPDAVVLDLDLPRGSGVRLLRQLRAEYCLPLVVCSRGAPVDGRRGAAAAAWGALALVRRPALRDRAAVRELAGQLAAALRTARAAGAAPGARPGGPLPGWCGAAGLSPTGHLVVVGASTGGPAAVHALLSAAPANFPPVLIVQHMPAMFTPAFAARLGRASALLVSEAAEGQRLRPGMALVARGDAHLTVQSRAGGWRAHYTDQARVNRHRPSVDVLFDSAVAAAGDQAVGILLTGMGADGARGLLRIRQSGGLTVGQEAGSCVVDGMPRAARELGAVQYSAAPAEIPALVLRALLARQRGRAAGRRR